MNNWKWLQLFADGAGDGAGEGAAATGDTTVGAADPHVERLLSLGVPKEKIRAQHTAALAKAAQAAPQQEQQQAAAATTETKRLSWDEIQKDEEYNKQIQNIVSKRVKETKAAQAAAEDKLSKLAPALELMAQKYGLDPANLDYEKLATAVSEDTAYYEQKALDMGVSVETAKHIDQLEREQARRQAENAKTAEEQALQNHFRKLSEQAQALKQTFPNFDLMTELKNPAFARMTAPNIGISVEDAYYACHRAEIQTASMQVAAQKTAENLSKTIQAGKQRPVENGTSAQAPSITTIDWRNASAAQREAKKAEIRAAAASGKKLYPGR